MIKNLLKNWYQFALVLVLVIAIGTRFIGLTQFPPSLYWEEAALGYDAYSILKTAHDLHGHFLPLVAFESFGDYKPSFYFYALVPSIAVFGLTDFAVRFPSAVAGVLLVVGVGFLAYELGKEVSLGQAVFTKKQEDKLPKILQLLAMLVTSLNPWAINFSRAGWEVNLATTFLTFGFWLQLLIRRILLGEQKKLPLNKLIFYFALSITLIASSMYTYHATRVIAPVLLLGFWLLLAFEIRQKFLRKQSFLKVVTFSKIWIILAAGIFFTLLISPIIVSLRSPQTQQRFAETSLFADGRQVILSNKLIEASQPHWLGKILYHRDVIGAQMLATNYLSHFNFSFLFLNGDKNPRHSTQFVGLMYTGEVIFFLAGLYFFFAKRNHLSFFLLFWLLVGIFPAALTTAAPHALRILPSLPIWMLILATGIFQFFELAQSILKQKWLMLILPILLVGFYTWEFVSYWRFYSMIYPQVYASEWQYGYQQLVVDLQIAQQKYPNLPVEVTREYGRPSMYYWFYTKTDPRQVQAEEVTAKKDQGEFLQFKNISFVDQLNIQQPTLVASSEKMYLTQKGKSQTQLLSEVRDLQGKVVWDIFTTH